jgi:hypothetical protein
METPTDMFSHAPDVSPEDVWGDAACLVADGHGPAVALPPKRVKEDKPAGRFAMVTDGDSGLRIGTRTVSHSSVETFPKLEVQEIDGNVVRLQPEEPEAERMPRHLVFHERPASVNEIELVGEAREWGKSRKQPIIWILGTGVAVTALVIGAILALPFVNKSNAARPGSGESDLIVETVANGEAMADMLYRKDEAKTVFRSFLAASSVDAMQPLLRNPGEVTSLIQASRHMPHLAPDFPPLKINSWTACENQSLTYGLLSGTMPDYSNFETYFIVSDSRLAMDWKASSAYGTADFSQLMNKQGNPAEIRCWIEAAEFYTLGFSENSYQAYQLASPDKQQVIWAYARRGSAIHRLLRTLIKGGYIIEGRAEGQKVTVRLAPGPDDSLPGQWEILELLHKEWIAP